MMHTLILKALFTPDAKNPPNGDIREAKVAMTSAWIKDGLMNT